MSPSRLRLASLVVYLALASLGVSLLARPAALWVRGLGLFAPALPGEVPLGAPSALLALAIAALTLRLSTAFALRLRPRLAEHAALLLLVALSLAARAGMGESPPAPDPSPTLVDALRIVATELDRDYARTGYYPADAARAPLAAAPAPGFRFRGRPLPIRLRIIPGAASPQRTPLRGDLPGTIYAAVSADAQRVWLTALTLRSGAAVILAQRPPPGLLGPGGPVVLEARSGTHGAPGRDPVVPVYPGMRALGSP